MSHMGKYKAVIMISGKQGSGKTALANAILRHYITEGIGTRAVKFAEPLYRMQDAVYSVLLMYNIDDLRPGQKDGPLLQVLGTEWGRNVKGTDIWVRCARVAVDRMMASEYANENGLVVTIDDLRFRNELSGFPEAIKIRLECSKEIRAERCGINWRDNDTHVSETELDSALYDGSFDLIINTGELSFQETVTQVIDFLNNRKASHA